MKIKKYRVSLFLWLLLFSALTSCNSAKKSISASKKEDCTHFAKVFDYSNVDGCGFVIENEKGERFIPLSVTESTNTFRFDANQRLSINYQIASGINLCELNLKSIDINCVQVLPSLPANCNDVDTPSPKWMQQMIKTLLPKTIEKVSTKTDVLYIYYCNANKVLFDCKGNRICEVKDTNNNTCNQFPTLSGKIIYKAETQAQ